MNNKGADQTAQTPPPPPPKTGFLMTAPEAYIYSSPWMFKVTMHMLYGTDKNVNGVALSSDVIVMLKQYHLCRI